jgi:hypothetical protein
MSFSKKVGPRSDAKTDVVGDRNHMIQIGMVGGLCKREQIK